MVVTCIALGCVSVFQETLTPLELSIISSPDDIRAHRAKMVTGERMQNLLDMTPEQRANCATLRDKIAEDFQKPESRRKPSNGAASIKDEVFRLTFDENDVGVDELLDAKQIKRLGQVQLQSLGPWAIFRLNCVAKHLDLSEEQRQEAERLSLRLSKETAEVFKTTPISKQAEATGRLAVAFKGKHLEILSLPQRAKLDELLGPLQDDSWRVDFAYKPDFGPSHMLRSRVGDLYQPLRLLFVDQFLDYLEVTPEERNKLIMLVADERKLMAERKRSSSWDLLDYARRGKEIVKQVESDDGRLLQLVQEVLGEKRTRRLHEAWRQVRNYDEVYSASATSKLLKVTPKQRQEFSDFFKENPDIDRQLLREKAASILTPQQRKQFEELKGEPLPPYLLTTLKSSRSGVNCDEFGIPYFGIGAGP